MFKEWIAVALGGMLGATARHGLSHAFNLLGPAWLPIATLIANVVGCFAIGWLAQWSFHQDLPNEWWVVGARVGLLGGLTTFSSFGLDIVRLWQEDRGHHSFAILAAHLLLGITAIIVGIAVAKSQHVPMVSE